MLGVSESGWKPCDATEDDLTVSPRGSLDVWAESGCVQIRYQADGPRLMAMIGRKVGKRGRLVEGEGVRPLMNDLLALVGQTSILSRREEQRRSGGGGQDANHVTSRARQLATRAGPPEALPWRYPGRYSRTTVGLARSPALAIQLSPPQRADSAARGRS